MGSAALRLTAHGPCIEDRIALGMAQLAPVGLSEQWVLRDCGDRHWSMIAEAAGRTGIAFRDAAGRPVYAAFCATSLDLSTEPGPLLGCEARIISRLFAMGPNRLGSLHRIFAGGRVIGRLRMMSCFLSHDESGSNRSLLKTTLPGLRELPAAPEELTALNTGARAMARTARAARPGTPDMSYTPVPALDFNAAGLLYFPVFSKIAEAAQPSQTRLLSREVVYLGNLDPGETITAETGDHGAILRTDTGRVLAFTTQRAI